jgi:beta-lactamase regulating signal transducer with metallopeptidase domain
MTAAWWLVSGFFLFRLMVSQLGISHLRRTAHPTDLDTLRRCDKLAERMGVRAPSLLVSPFVASPCLIGLFRPAILLPSEQEGDWPSRRAFILHELAHLRRRDCVWNLIAHAAKAILCFQPLVWVLVRQMVKTAEEVCDDHAVHFGADRHQYARSLVDFAARYQPPPWPVAAAGVSLKSAVGRRVARVLDGSRRPSLAAGRRVGYVLPVLATAATLLVAILGANGRAAVAAPSDDKPAEQIVDVAPTGGDDWIEVRGRVVDPTGKPFANATVYAARWYWNGGQRRPLDEAKTDAAGRFRVAYRKSQMNVPVGRPTPWLDVMIAAVADGFGPGWVDVEDTKPAEEVTLRLVKDDVPVKGRVVDNEGNPIEGVTVTVSEISASADEDLTKWLEAVRMGQTAELTWKYLNKSLLGYATGLPAKLATDADGRFQLEGVGAERRVRLTFEAPTIARSAVSVLTRDMKDLALTRASEWSGKVKYYGATFEYQAQPTQAIIGTIRDAESGEPLSGAAVYSYSMAGSNVLSCGTIKATSNQLGRYRLTGMPLGKGNSLLAVPTDDQPYFLTEKDVPELQGGDPVTVDFELKRGIMIRGLVADQVTGTPVVGQIHYLPFLSNPHARQYANFEYSDESWGRTHGAGFQDRYVTAPDGSYQVVGLPGRGLVGVVCHRGPYRLGQGTEEIQPKGENGYILTYNNPIQCFAKWPHAVHEINPPADVEVFQCDFQLDPGAKVKLVFVDPEGQPLKEVQLDGQDPTHGYMQSPLETNEAEIVGLVPGQPRNVLCYHKKRNLGAVVEAMVGPNLPTQQQVTLQPCATVTGRLLDDQGDPVTGARLEAWILPRGDFGKSLPLFTSDEDGRFHYDALLPGRDYYLEARTAEFRYGAVVAEEISATSSGTIHLGEVKLKRRGS